MRRKAHSIAADPKRKGKKYLYEKYSERGANASSRRRGKCRGNFFTYVRRAKKAFDDSDTIMQPFKNHMAKIGRILRTKA